MRGRYCRYVIKAAWIGTFTVRLRPLSSGYIPLALATLCLRAISADALLIRTRRFRTSDCIRMTGCGLGNAPTLPELNKLLDHAIKLCAYMHLEGRRYRRHDVFEAPTSA
jgi:hypothetical protein